MDIARNDVVEWTGNDGSTLKGVVVDVFITTNMQHVPVPMLRINTGSGPIYAIYADPDSLAKKNLIVKGYQEMGPSLSKAEQERASFEAWAASQWQNSNPPENAWKGWIARAQLANKS
jgi:hypothetical protein